MPLWKYWAVTMVVVILFGAGRAHAQNVPAVSVTFQGAAVNAEVKVLVKDQIKYINLPFLSKYLRVTADWQAESGAIRLKLGKDTYQMAENKSTYQLNGVEKQFSAAPFEQDGQLWITVDFLRNLGIALQQDDDQTLVLDWAEDYLLAVENLSYQGRPALLLVGTKPLLTKDFLLREPDRLVIDLAGFKAHPSLDTAATQNQLVPRIRFSQFQADTLRLVCDLGKKRGYQLIADPRNANQLILVFNYFVQEVNFSGADGVERVQIKTDYPGIYTVKKLDTPARAVIDFSGATLDAPALPNAGEGKYFKRVRMSQFDPQTVRVVLDLADAKSPYQIVASRKNPLLVEAHTVQTVKELQWLEPTPDSGQLVVTGNGELIEQVRKLKKPARLQIDLDFFRFAPALKAPLVNDINQIKGIRLIPVSPTLARIEVDLRYIAGYDVKLSEDWRRLIVTFWKSPVIGKTFVLDPGHGGVDRGTAGKQGLKEKDVNLEVAFRTKDLLEEAGAKVVMTRNGNNFIGLFERAYLANRFSSELFVSIHSNFHPNPKVRGVEVYYCKGMTESGRLAKQVETQLVKSTKFATLGVKINDFAVIRESLMPSILVELGFLSNFQEESLMKTAEYKENAALGIFRGIIGFYKPNLTINLH